MKDFFNEESVLGNLLYYSLPAIIVTMAYFSLYKEYGNKFFSNYRKNRKEKSVRKHMEDLLVEIESMKSTPFIRQDQKTDCRKLPNGRMAYNSPNFLEKVVNKHNSIFNRNFCNIIDPNNADEKILEEYGAIMRDFHEQVGRFYPDWNRWKIKG